MFAKNYRIDVNLHWFACMQDMNQARWLIIAVDLRCVHTNDEIKRFCYISDEKRLVCLGESIKTTLNWYLKFQFSVIFFYKPAIHSSLFQCQFVSSMSLGFVCFYSIFCTYSFISQELFWDQLCFWAVRKSRNTLNTCKLQAKRAQAEIQTTAWRMVDFN